MTLERKLRRREGLRAFLHSTVKSIEEYLNGDGEITETKLRSFKSMLDSACSQLSVIDGEITQVMDPEKIKDDVVESMQLMFPASQVEAAIDLKLQEIAKPSDTASVSFPTHSVSSGTSVSRLPKIELPTFKGDPLKWQGFWDQFKTSIHENERINDIDRFNFLKRYLGGEALDSIKGLNLNSENYKEAIDILCERYGNEQVLISAHMQSLLKIQKIRSKDNIKSLRTLYNHVESCVRNLKALKLEAQGYGSLLIPILKEKLPDELKIVISRKFGSSIWTLDLLLTYLNEELRAQENCTTSVGSKSERTDESEQLFSASGLFSNTEKSVCAFCKKNHGSSKCRKVTNIQSRKDILIKEKRCFVCLARGHRANACKERYSCNRCNKRHHIAICDEGKKRFDGDSTLTAQISADANSNSDLRPSCSCSCSESATVPISSCCAQTSSRSVLLQTATSDIFGASCHNSVKTRLLFDTGSQRSYITNELKERLNLKCVRKENVVIKTFGDLNNTEIKRLEVVQFKVKHRKSSRYVLVEALCVPDICSPIANQKLNHAKKMKEFSGLEFADFSEEFDLSIGVLVGIDFYFRFFTGKRVESKDGVVASESSLGWILSGSIVSKCLTKASYSHQMRIEVQTVDSKLDAKLHRFWQIEETENTEDISVIDQFTKHIYHDGTRYVTKLPFKPDHESIPDNFSTCVKRLDSLNKRLDRLEINKEYETIFSDYERDGIIERVPDSQIAKEEGTVHYIPHRPVIREDRITTKIRPVFDASCSANGVSLNDCLYSGPNLLAKIFDILLRFRLNKIGILADIKQAFLNINIHPDHRDFLRFLWRDPSSSNKEIVVYRFLRVVFGLTSSPFLLNGTIRQHMSKYIDTEKQFVNQFLSDLYVDDITTGSDTIEDGKIFYEKASSSMSGAGLQLRKWTSNDTELQSFFSSKEPPLQPKSVEDDSSFAQSQFESQGDYKRVLGVEWDLSNDKFIFRFHSFLEKGRTMVLTKRNILSLSASIYDPLGIVTPITARVKTIFQLICKVKCGWDEKVPPDIARIWNDFLEALESVKIVEIDRFAFVSGTSDTLKHVELHGFCDSSKIVYCAVVYLRVVTEAGIKVFFLTSKSKVAPLKEVTIPRLELLSCLLLSNLMKNVRSALSDRVSVDATYCWSDSKVALCWIRGNRKTWKPWVENRVVSVRKEIRKDDWHHIPGKDNPSDVPTRMVSQFKESFSDKWFNGPEILYDSDKLSNFLSDELSLLDSDKSDILSEARNRFVDFDERSSSNLFECKDTVLNDSLSTLFTETDNSDNDIGLSKIIDVGRYSTLQKLLNVTAFVYRFISNVKSKISRRPVIEDNVISADEQEAALKNWVKEEQRLMQHATNFEKQTKSLGLFKKDDVLRVRGRFNNANITTDQKHPILLRNITSPFTKLVVLQSHERTKHQGIDSTLADVRRRFWIVQGRKAVKNTIRKCVVCIRYQGRTLRLPPTPDLPDFRVEYNERCFNSVGMDFAGPLYFRNFLDNNKDKRDSLKCYILLLTCATSRAVHLELVPDLSKHSFIRAFKRFVGRRGTPSLVISDNAKTFRSSSVKRFMSSCGIKQKFILPASPWWGGFYERLVRSVKISLKKILGLSYLTYEELETVLIEVESTINTRPLTYVNEDDTDTVITPNHLIFGTDIHDNYFFVANSAFVPVKRLRHLNKVLEHFRKRFLSTYINELRQTHIYQKSNIADNRNLVMGDIVIVKDDNPLPRSRWPIAKVQEVIRGSDGHIRGAKLTTITKNGKKGSIHRPLSKIIPFEIAVDQSSQPLPDSLPLTKIAPVQMVENCEKVAHNRGRTSMRKAAIEGQNLRRLREQFL